MRVLRLFGIVVGLMALVSLTAAVDKNLGIRDTYHVTFVEPVRIGTALLPAGAYTIRHTMEGQEHIMVFQPVEGKGAALKAKCTLVPLAKRADRDQTTYQVNAANERVLQELVFRGDTAKHVF